MFFSRASRGPLARAARCRFTHGVCLGGQVQKGSCLEDLPSPSALCGGGSLRSYLTSCAAHPGVEAGIRLADSYLWWSSPVLFRRLLSTEGPKKKDYENFYPKGKKAAEKGDGNQKSESKD